MSPMPQPITAPPDPEELAGRLAKIRSLMEKQELDCYVSFNPVNIYYLTNFANNVHERPFILILPRQGTPVLLCPLLEAGHVKARARCALEYVTYDEVPTPEGRNWFDIYKTLIEPGAKVGIESSLPIGIARETPGNQIVTDLIEDLRLIKSPYEIGRTVHACTIVNEGHRKLLEITRPGSLEIAIYGEVVREMMGRTLMEIPNANLIVTKFIGAVWPPSLSHDPHLVPTPFTAMEAGGPHVSIVTAQVDGYGVEVERTFFLGKVPERARRPFETVMEARALAYERVKPGAVLEEIDRQVRQVIIDAGYGSRIIHRTGHGLGITGHEGPYLALGDVRTLVPGMVISIEPGLYIPGEGGFRYSDTVLVTERGCLRLTEAPETLDGLTLSV